MIHVVTSHNRHLYARQLWDMFRIRKRHYIDERGWTELWRFGEAELDDSDDERAVYVMALDEAEDLVGFVRIRPTDDHCILVDKFPYLVEPHLLPLKGPETWEGSRIWFDQRAGDAHGGMHRLLTAAAEYILRRGGARLLAFIDIHNFPHLSDGALDFRMTGAPAAYRYGVMVGVQHAVCEEAVDRMCDALGEVRPLSYVVEDEDVAVHGSLGRIQAEVDRARLVDSAAMRIERATPAKTMAGISASYARFDSSALSPGFRLISVLPGRVRAGA